MHKFCDETNENILWLPKNSHKRWKNIKKKHVKIVKMHDFLKGAKVGSTYFSYLIEYMD